MLFLTKKWLTFIVVNDKWKWKWNYVGVAVGCGWQAFVAYVNVGCYYVVGVPFGCLLAFYFELGAKVQQLSSNQISHTLYV